MTINVNDVVRVIGADGELGRVCRVDAFTCQIFFVQSGCLMVNTVQLETLDDDGSVSACPDDCC